MINLYDTAVARKVEPQLSRTVSIYVCGITPYDSAHLGHAFTFMAYDVLQRYLEHKGHTVHLVRNITDVDEPMFKKAKELNMPYLDLAELETKKFQQVMLDLNIRAPHAEPRASQYILEMANAVAALTKSSHAYKLANGDVYFDTAKDPSFGSNSHFSESLQLAFTADRGGDPDRPDKRNKKDFLLWKSISDETDPARWDSPVGPGRPGWHIECSVMSQELLGTPLDIHGGGMDLIYPHHEAENAQSSALGHVPLSKRWMHVAPLSYHGEKMSKSLGNLVFAGDLIRDHDPNSVRLALLGYHYRIGGEWIDDELTEATNRLRRIRTAQSKQHGPNPEPFLAAFFEAIENDLNTPAAVTVLLEYCEAITTQKDNAEHEAKPALDTMFAILGLTA